MRLGLTQAELGRRVGCAPITVRKIEADALRPSVLMAERLALALNIPEVDQAAFVRLARVEREPISIPTPPPTPEEIGVDDLSGRAVRGCDLGERIGTGGFGVVYRAVQSVVGRDVAIKIVLPRYADNPEFIRRFESEAQLVAHLEHPHIVPLYDYWREPGAAYLVMRYLRGGSLDRVLQSGPMHPTTVLNIMEQIGAGLHIAHRAGVIHRDIKPANILLDENGNAYLADFGIAKQVGISSGVERTREMAMIGSPPYISPEQILVEPVRPQADIYSLGIVLYELLSGRKPFKGPTPVAYIRQHLNELLPLLSSETVAAPQITAIAADPTPADTVIARATAKQPQDRYPDVPTFLSELRHALADHAASRATTNGSARSTGAYATELIDFPDLESPYKGLRPFAEADADDFFGRETLIQDLLERLEQTDDTSRFLAVVGPSGSGKSSVVRAGLLPALRKGRLPGSEHWFITDMLPGAQPLAELEAALARIATQPADLWRQHLHSGERGLLRAVRHVLPLEPGAELLLVIDQFEELFTQVEDETTRTRFLNMLVTAILDPESRLPIVITLRADFTDQPLRYADLGELVSQRSVFVLPLNSDELEQAIIKPTERAGLRLEPGLTQTIIREIGEHPGMLPLLQYALSELFERRNGRMLTLRAYRESGGVSGALARRADQLYEQLQPDAREMARQVFLRLVTLGEGVEDTRRRVLQTELSQLSIRLPNTGPSLDRPVEQPAAALVEAVLNLFGRYRLLTFDRDPLTRNPTVEVAHEAILREWKRLREWVGAARTDIRLQRMLAVAAAEWLDSGRNEGYLLSGARLDQFTGWAATTRVALTRNERSLLSASLLAHHNKLAEDEARRQREFETVQKLAETEARRARESARSATNLRWLAVGLAALLIAATGLAWFAVDQQAITQRNFEQSEQTRLAAQAQIALDNGEGGDLPALLAMRSLRYGYTPEADAALLEALNRGFPKQIYTGHTDFIPSVAFSPDGRSIVSSYPLHNRWSGG